LGSNCIKALFLETRVPKSTRRSPKKALFFVSSPNLLITLDALFFVPLTLFNYIKMPSKKALFFVATRFAVYFPNLLITLDALFFVPLTLFNYIKVPSKKALFFVATRFAVYCLAVYFRKFASSYNGNGFAAHSPNLLLTFT